MSWRFSVKRVTLNPASRSTVFARVSACKALRRHPGQDRGHWDRSPTRMKADESRARDLTQFLPRGQIGKRAAAGRREAAILHASALLAQLVEHLHGKEGVSGSSPEEGFSAPASLDGRGCTNRVRLVGLSLGFSETPSVTISGKTIPEVDPTTRRRPRSTAATVCLASRTSRTACSPSRRSAHTPLT